MTFGKMHFIRGLQPSIRQVVESRYASLINKVMLLNTAKEAEIAVSMGADKQLMELEAKIAALRVSPRRLQQQHGRKPLPVDYFALAVATAACKQALG